MRSVSKEKSMTQSWCLTSSWMQGQILSLAWLRIKHIPEAIQTCRGGSFLPRLYSQWPTSHYNSSTLPLIQSLMRPTTMRVRPLARQVTFSKVKEEEGLDSRMFILGPWYLCCWTQEWIKIGRRWERQEEFCCCCCSEVHPGPHYERGRHVLVGVWEQRQF